jgi:hypothetical protein
MAAVYAPRYAPSATPWHARRRGTRGFAAVVLFLTAMIVLSVAVVVLPATTFDRLSLTWLIGLGLTFGIAHLVAVYGVLRRRAWTTPLTLYLMAIGLGLVSFGLLVELTGGTLLPSATAAWQGADVTGLLVWLAGSWIVAARFVLRGLAAPVTRPIPTAARAVEPRSMVAGRRTLSVGAAA